jgi:long-chain-fatty-acid--CoA ligase ACSBG
MGKGRLLSLLPLSHVASQLCDLVITLKLGASLYFADPSALQGNIVKFLQVSRP